MCVVGFVMLIINFNQVLNNRFLILPSSFLLQVIKHRVNLLAVRRYILLMMGTTNVRFIPVLFEKVLEIFFDLRLIV